MFIFTAICFKLIVSFSDACDNASILSDDSRYFENINATDRCDATLVAGWYRFQYQGREAEIPTNCIGVTL